MFPAAISRKINAIIPARYLNYRVHWIDPPCRIKIVAIAEKVNLCEQGAVREGNNTADEAGTDGSENDFKKKRY